MSNWEGLFRRPGLRVYRASDQGRPRIKVNATCQLSPLDVRALVSTLQSWLDRIGYDPGNPCVLQPPEGGRARSE